MVTEYLSLWELYEGNLEGGFQWRTQEFFSGGGSTNSVEDRGQRERGSGGGSPLIWRQL